MTDAIFAIPERRDSLTSNDIYDRRVLALMPSFGIEAAMVAIPGTFPNPSQSDIAAARDAFGATESDCKIVVDGLVFGTLPADVLEAFKERLFAIVHHPLAHASGLSEDRRRELFASEKASLAVAHRIIATGPHTRSLLIDDYGIAADKITVAEPGTDPAPRASGTGTPLQLLAVGSVLKRRNYDVLVDALVPLADLDWRLTIVGALDRDDEAVSSLEKKIAASGFTERISLSGSVVPATLERLYESTDIFIMPARVEGYAMALCDAMVRGLPIISTFGGAAEQSLPDDVALKVAAGDVEPLRNALQQLLLERKTRARLADAAWEAGRLLPTWNETARRVGATIMGLRI